MTDISKCGGHNCDRKEQCLRFTAPEGPRQSWIAGRYDPQHDHCESFLSKDKRSLDVLHEERLKLVLELEAENTKLRALLAKSNADCVYCGAKAADLSKCPKGFPGCGRADDLVLGDDC